MSRILGPNKPYLRRDPDAPGEREANWRLLVFTRLGVPVGIAVAGVVMIVIGKGQTNSAVAVIGLCLIGVAVMVWMLNWMYRMSLESNDDREAEERARDFFTLHGYWPDDNPE